MYKSQKNTILAILQEHMTWGGCGLWVKELDLWSERCLFHLEIQQVTTKVHLSQTPNP